MRLLIVLSCVAVSGCVQPTSGPEVVAPAVGDARIDDLLKEVRSLRGELDRTRQEVNERHEAARSSAAAKYTGAYVHIAKGWSCPPCDRLKRDLKAHEHLGWKIGTKPDDHFRLIGHAEDEGLTVPYVEYVRDDVVFETLEGYAGDIDQILRTHPRAKKSPKKATGTESYGMNQFPGTGNMVYGQPIYGAPVFQEPAFQENPVWSSPVVFRDSAPATFQTDYFFGIPVRTRQCMNGVCW